MLSKSLCNFALEGVFHTTTLSTYHPQVAGHVIRAFGGVDEVVGVFGAEAFEDGVEIGPSRRVGVFVDDEAGAGVLEEDRAEAGGDTAFADDAGDFVGDLGGALAAGGEGEGGGVRFHRCGADSHGGTGRMQCGSRAQNSRLARHPAEGRSGERRLTRAGAMDCRFICHIRADVRSYILPPTFARWDIARMASCALGGLIFFHLDEENHCCP